MAQQADSTSSNNSTPPNDGHVVKYSTITLYKRDERSRWKKRVLSLIFIGFLISILVHLNIGALLSLLQRDIKDSITSGEMTTVQFAIEDTNPLNQLPEGQQLQEQESVPSEIPSDSLHTTDANLIADGTESNLNSSAQAITPSLSGSGSSRMGSGIGGSGGGTSFFGISSTGSRFCYIVDVSGSMQQQNRLRSALTELERSLKRLPDFTKFFVLFYSSGYTTPPMQKGWNTARSSTVRRMIKEFDNIQPGGGTRPKGAFVKALSLEPLPEVIYFLTDGEISSFNSQILKSIIPTGKKVVVNTIAFGDSSSQQKLIDISNLTGGQYKFVPTGDKK